MAEVEDNNTRLHEERVFLRSLLEGEFSFDEELRAKLGEGFDAGEVRRKEGRGGREERKEDVDQLK